MLILKMSLLVIITCFAIISAAQATPIVNLTVTDNYIKVGESFKVNVSVDDTISPNLGDLIAFGFDVDSSLSLFSFESVNSSINPDFFDLSMGNYIGGLKDIMAPSNAGSDILLASLSFKANNVGTESLEIDAFDHGLYYDFGDSCIDVLTDITINPSSQAPVPEPGTVLLLCLGLISLTAFKIKIRTSW